MHAKIAIRVALFGLGFLSVSTQIYLIREFLCVFHGNELIMGLVLAMWMLLTGTGAYVARYIRQGSISYRLIFFLLLFLAFLPPVLLISLDALCALLIPEGMVAGFCDVLITGILLLFPFCFINGFLFSVLSVKLQKTFMTAAYSIESTGSMFAGLLVNFILLWMFDVWLSIIIITGLMLLFVLVFSFFLNNRPLLISGIAISLSYVILLLLFDYHGYSGRIRFSGQTILVNRETPYGKVVVTSAANQYNLYENGMLLSSSRNEITDEANIHFAMVQHPSPKQILQISGGFSGSSSEIYKYQPRNIDYVELNPVLNEIAPGISQPFQSSALHVITADARQFIRETEKKYDVVLICLPGPASIQLNRFYTDEFFAELKKKMTSGAVVSISLPTGNEYIGKQSGNLNSGIYNTLKKNFNHVLPVPVERNYFLASDSLLRINIPELVSEKGIPTLFVNSYYLDSRQMKDRSDFILKNISDTTPVNKDFRPLSLVYQLLWSMKIFSLDFLPLMVGTTIILLIIFLTLNPVSAGLFTGGFTLASLEVIVIIALQVISGLIYQMIGIIIMLFMAGLAVGSKISVHIFPKQARKGYLFLQVAIAFYSVIFPFILVMLHSLSMPGIVVQISLAVLALIISGIAGIQYGLAARFSTSSPLKVIAGNYSADLFGAAFGAFLVTVVLFPLLGLILTGVTLSMLNLLSATLLFFRKSVPLYSSFPGNG